MFIHVSGSPRLLAVLTARTTPDEPENDIVTLMRFLDETPTTSIVREGGVVVSLTYADKGDITEAVQTINRTGENVTSVATTFKRAGILKTYVKTINRTLGVISSIDKGLV